MSFWSEIDLKLKNNFQLNEDEKLALTNFVRRKGNQGKEFLRQTYSQSSQQVEEIIAQASVDAPTCSECGAVLESECEKERGTCTYCWGLEEKYVG